MILDNVKEFKVIVNEDGTMGLSAAMSEESVATVSRSSDSSVSNIESTARPTDEVQEIIMHHWTKQDTLADDFAAHMTPAREWLGRCMTYTEKWYALRKVNPRIHKMSASRIIGCAPNELSPSRLSVSTK